MSGFELINNSLKHVQPQLQQTFLASLKSDLTSHDKIALALNQRQSIDCAQGKPLVTSRNYKEILEKFDQTTENLDYSIRAEERLGAQLQEVGIDIEGYKKSEILIYEAVLFELLTQAAIPYCTLQVTEDKAEVFATEQREFKLRLAQSAKPLIEQDHLVKAYAATQDQFRTALNDQTLDPKFKAVANALLNAIEQDFKKLKIKNIEHYNTQVAKFTKALNVGVNAVAAFKKGPGADRMKTLEACTQLSKEFSHSRKKKWISGLLIGLGICLILGSGALAAFSFGILAPLSVYGVVLSTGLIGAGIAAMGAGAAGVAAVTTGSFVLKQDPVQKKLENLQPFLQAKVGA